MSTMAASSKRRRMDSGEGVREPSKKKLRRWEDLNPDLLDRIFDGIGFYQLSRNISSVCRSWKLACWYRFFWLTNVLDLGLVAPTLATIYTNHNQKNDKVDAAKLMKQLKTVTEGYEGCGYPLEKWRQSIREILIPEDMKILDRHIAYIAERTVGIESLKLYGSSKITPSGFARALANWKNVKSICLGHVKFHNHVIEQIGRNCYSLESLCLYMYGFHIRQGNAVVILKCLQHLKDFKMYGASVHVDGIRYIFSNTFGPEAIEFCDCFLMEDDPPRLGHPIIYDLCPRTFTLERRDEKWCLNTDKFKHFIARWMEIEEEL